MKNIKIETNIKTITIATLDDELLVNINLENNDVIIKNDVKVIVNGKELT